jgi:hypothetical protein
VRAPDADIGSSGILRWRRIDDERSLAAWERAWRGADGKSQRIFRRELLLDRRAIVLGGMDRQETIRAGGIAYDAAGALGLTNIFGPRPDFIHALAAMLPARQMVGYEAGADLQSAEQTGFRLLGPLRVWVKSLRTFE